MIRWPDASRWSLLTEALQGNIPTILCQLSTPQSNFLSSGIFLGWSLGANDAANVFGAAVGSRMVRFKTAALIGIRTKSQ